MALVKRSYLRAGDRRRQLLDAAQTLFAREGLPGLSMVGLAAEAGVSRRLVYEHFSGIEDLYRAFFADRAAIYQASIDRAFAEGHGDLLASAVGVFRRLIEIPADDQRAVRLLLAAPGPSELEPISAQFRARLMERWLRLLDQHALDHDIACALVWALANAFFALGQLVSRGEVTPERATVLVRAIVASAVNGATAAFR